MNMGQDHNRMEGRGTLFSQLAKLGGKVFLFHLLHLLNLTPSACHVTEALTAEPQYLLCILTPFPSCGFPADTFKFIDVKS